MRYLFFISFLLVSQLYAQSTVYITDDFALYLQEDASFIFYPKEISLKTNVTGNYLLRGDSLILTTHKFKGQQAIFAIYNCEALHLNLVHFQKEFALSLPQSFYISKTYYADKSLKQSYRWTNKKNGDYDLYTFSGAQNLLSMEHFIALKLEGPQLYYFDNPYAALERQLHFKAGLIHGTSYFFEALDEDFLKVRLIQEKKYKNGELKQIKTPATPLVFYTSHF
jgi:hypothetical protein